MNDGKMSIRNNIDEFMEDYRNVNPKVIKREFSLSDELKTMGADVIREKMIDTHPAKIGYVLVTPNISKTIPAKIIKTSKELKFFSGLDYVIEVSGEIWDALDKETKKVLLEHELRHILVLQNDKSGDWTFKIRKHDVQDFSKVISENGIEWIKKIKLCLSSIYDLTPAEEDAIQI